MKFFIIAFVLFSQPCDALRAHEGQLVFDDEGLRAVSLLMERWDESDMPRSDRCDLLTLYIADVSPALFHSVTSYDAEHYYSAIVWPSDGRSVIVIPTTTIHREKAIAHEAAHWLASCSAGLFYGDPNHSDERIWGPNHDGSGGVLGSTIAELGL